MKKKIIFFVTLVCVIAAGTAAAVLFFSGQRPFKHLRASEIVSATVCLSPPDKTVRIAEIEELVKYLNDVVIYQKDDSYTGYNGQGVTFTLTMRDGTQKRIMAYNPFLIIDGVGYRTKYEPCEALNAYANGLLGKGDVVILLDEPPALTVMSDETAHGALLGTYSWQCENGDGTAKSVEADSAHPLDCESLLTPLETTEKTAVLRFGEEPDRIVSVRCWSDAYWSEPAAGSEAVTVTGNEIELKSGGYIYEVIAEWDAEDGYGGTAYYAFYVKTSE